MTRNSLFLFMLAVVALRLLIGFHFFFEGSDKLKSGKFQAAGFLSAAKGPLAPYFQGMLDDPSGASKLCVTIEPESETVRLDPSLTFALWDDFVDRATAQLQFGDEQIIAERKQRIQQLSSPANAPGAEAIRIAELESAKSDLEAVKRQPTAASQLLKSHQAALADWLESHRTELIAHFSTADRLNGFRRDGEAARAVATHVDSLRGQVDQIRTDRTGQVQRWSSEVLTIWDSLETGINELARGSQKGRGAVILHRPFDQPQSKLKWINRLIPWFDTLVGACLVLGFLTRPAAMAGGLFLASICLTQPFWIPGTTPTYYQLVEMAGLFLLATIPVDQSLGLDMLIWRRRSLEGNARASAGEPEQVVSPTS